MKLETPIHAKHHGCLTCGGTADVLDVSAEAGGVIAVGFGSASLERDGEVVYKEKPSDEDFFTFAQAEEMAAADPDHDWRIHLIGALRERHYQRQPGGWMLYRDGEGFA